jgi:DNA gyrase subunit A
VLIRTRVSEIREMGRATQGVTLIAVEDGTKLSGLQRVVETDIDEVELTTEAGTDAAPAAAEPADPVDPAQPE